MWLVNGSPLIRLWQLPPTMLWRACFHEVFLNRRGISWRGMSWSGIISGHTGSSLAFSVKIIIFPQTFQASRSRCQSLFPPRRCLPIMCSTLELCSSLVAIEPQYYQLGWFDFDLIKCWGCKKKDIVKKAILLEGSDVHFNDHQELLEWNLPYERCKQKQLVQNTGQKWFAGGQEVI